MGWLRRSVAIAGVCLMVVGCGKPPAPQATADGAAPPTAAPQAITIWWAQWAPAEGLQELGNEFEKETGIAVNVHQIPWADFQDQVFVGFTKKQTSFDIVVGDSQWLGRYATKGLYLELTDWLPGAVDLDAVHANARRYLCEYPAGSGKYFAAPCETDAVGFSYRRDWFEDAAEQAAFKARFGRALTPPTTWAAFKEVAEFFHRPDAQRYGCVLLTGRGYDSLVMGFQQVMWAFGGSWGDEKTYDVEGYINGPESVAALTYFKSLVAMGPPDAAISHYGTSLESFLNGSTAMAMNYFAFYPGIDKKMGDQAGYFVMPAHGDHRVISLGGQGFSISTRVPAAQQLLAKKFIAWFLQEDVQRQWITKDAGFTANTRILASDEFRQATPYNAPFADSLDDLRDFWNIPIYNELLADAQQYIAECLDDKLTPQAALDALAAAHRARFEEAGLAK